MPDFHIHAPFQGMAEPLQALLIGIALVLIIVPSLAFGFASFTVFLIACVLIIGGIFALLSRFGIFDFIENLSSSY